MSIRRRLPQLDADCSKDELRYVGELIFQRSSASLSRGDENRCEHDQWRRHERDVHHIRGQAPDHHIARRAARPLGITPSIPTIISILHHSHHSLGPCCSRHSRSGRVNDACPDHVRGRRNALGQLYATQIASAIATKDPAEKRTVVVGLGLEKAATDREEFMGILDLVLQCV